MTAAKRVLRYLKQTRDLSLTNVKDSPEAIIGYSDADWAGDVQDRRSTSGNVFLLGGGATVVQQKTELGGSVDRQGRVHGFECHYSRSRLAKTTLGRVRCDRGRSHVDLRRQPRSDLHGQESCLP